MKKSLALAVVCLSLNACEFLDLENPSPGAMTNDETIVTGFNLQIEKHANTSDWVYCSLGEFDFHSIANIDSIIFEPNLRSQSNEEICIAELFDEGKDQPVLNSQVVSKVRYFFHRVRSKNLASSLSNEPVQLSLRFRSSIDNHNVEIGIGSSIIVYSH